MALPSAVALNPFMQYELDALVKGRGCPMALPVSSSITCS
jgi:hypothetical protein